MATYLEPSAQLHRGVVCLNIGFKYQSKFLTKNGCLARIVQTNDYDAHLLRTYKPAEQLRKNESHLY